VLSAGWSFAPGDDRLWFFRIEANAFCHQMVRSVVGTLVAVGQGRIPAGELLAIVRGGDRSRSGQPPLRGLCLMGVEYPDSLVPGGRGSLARATGPPRGVRLRLADGPASSIVDCWLLPAELEVRAL